MNAILKTCIFLGALVAYSSADCASSCAAYCNVISASCGANPLGAQLGINCTAIGEGCTATCSGQYCTCVTAAGGGCVQAREACRTPSGVVDLICEMEFNMCVASGTGSCFGEVGANTFAGVLQLLGQMFQGMGGK